MVKKNQTDSDERLPMERKKREERKSNLKLEETSLPEDRSPMWDSETGESFNNRNPCFDQRIFLHRFQVTCYRIFLEETIVIREMALVVLQHTILQMVIFSISLFSLSTIQHQ
jgi:hypothetical protein